MKIYSLLFGPTGLNCSPAGIKYSDIRTFGHTDKFGHTDTFGHMDKFGHTDTFGHTDKFGHMYGHIPIYRCF